MLSDDIAVRDLNKFFGFEPEHKAKITHRALKEKAYTKVLMALMAHRLSGGNFSTADGLRGVTDNTNIPIRIVEEIYNENIINYMVLQFLIDLYVQTQMILLL